MTIVIMLQGTSKNIYKINHYKVEISTRFNKSKDKIMQSRIITFKPALYSQYCSSIPRSSSSKLGSISGDRWITMPKLCNEVCVWREAAPALTVRDEYVHELCTRTKLPREQVRNAQKLGTNILYFQRYILCPYKPLGPTAQPYIPSFKDIIEDGELLKRVV